MNTRLFRCVALITTLALMSITFVVQIPEATAQVSTVTLGVPYTQNFDTLPASGSTTWTNNSNIPGWFHARTGTGTTIVANDGSSNAGNLYSYGTGTATDRALGSLGSGNAAVGNLFWGVRLQNNTGTTITQLDVSYVGEQWRNSAAAAQTVAFSYLVGSPTVTGSLAEFQSAGVAVSSLDFTSPITGGAPGALNGNLAANRVAKSFSITGLSIPNGTEVMLRWADPDHTGADRGLAIDDFSVTAQGATPMPNLTITDVTQSEGDAGTTTFTFQVNLNAPAGPGGVTFDIATADGTAQDDNPPATEDNDYVAQSLTGQTIAAGNSSFAFNMTVNGDTVVEANETFFVNVTNVTGANVTDGQGQGTITNDDVPPPTLSINDVTQIETNAGTTTFAFTVSLSGPPGPGGVTFDIATADGTAQDDNPAATEDNDYVAQSLTGQTITGSNTTYTFNVTVNGDVAVEPDETFFVNVTNVVGATPGDTQGQGTIQHDDLPTLSINDVSQTEGSSGATTFTFTVSLSDPAPATVTFDIATADGTAQDDNPAATEDNDYVAQSLTAQTIAAGTTTYTFTVTVNGDTAIEPNETFVVNVDDIEGATAGDLQGLGTILNDDFPILSIDDVSQIETDVGATTFRFTVSLSAPSPANVTFDIATADGTAQDDNPAATEDNDYVARSLTGQLIAASNTTFTFDVTVNGDTVFEPNETFLVNVTNVAGATPGDTQGQGTIQNDDSAPPPPNLTINDVTQNEGDAGTTTFRFTISLSSPAGAGGVTFDIATANGTATAGSDYDAQSVTGRTIQAGSTSTTFDVTVNGDATIEPNEAFSVNVTNVVGATVADGQGIGTIVDDDQAGGISFSAATASVPENAGSVTITVQRSGGAGPNATGSSPNVPSGSVRPGTGTVVPNALTPVSVSFATADQTAQAGQDYVATAGTLTFGVNETTKTIVIPILADTLQEGSESFLVTLSNPTGGATLGAQATIAVVIVDTSHGAAGNPGDDSADDEREERERETEEERRQRERTNRGNNDDDAVEGDVIEVHCDDPWPNVVIANRDGAVEVKLIKEAQKACSSISVGDYLEADGEKQHEFLFYADSVEIKRRR